MPRNPSRPSLFAALAAIAVLAQVSPAGAATVKGTVRDRNGSPGHPLAGVTLYVWQHGGGFANVVSSGPDGYFESYAPDGAVYNIAANKPDQRGFQVGVATAEADNVAVASGAVVVNFDLDAGVGVDASGATYPAIVAEFHSRGGASAAGAPYDNGGGAPVHRWGPKGSVQDLRGGAEGVSIIMLEDGTARAFSVLGGAFATYCAAGGPAGALGYPLAEASATAQRFEGGSIALRNGIWVVARRSVGALGGVALGGPPAARPQERMGLDLGAPLDAQGSALVDADLAASTATHWMRVNFLRGPWSAPDDATRIGGRTWFEAFDAIVDALRARGLTVYGLVNTEAIADDPGVLRRPASDAAASAYADRFASEAAAVVGHFKDRVRVFELVNEPNDWAGGSSARVDPGALAAILARTYAAVKVAHAGDPSWQVTLVSGPLFSFPGTDGSDYLRAVYDAGRASGEWPAVRAAAGSLPLDGVGYHIYELEGAGDTPAEVAGVYARHLDAISSALAAEDPGAAAKKIWVSEFGWRSSFGEAHQADMLAAGFAALSADPRVAMEIYFSLTDFEAEGYGLRRQDGTAKAALARFESVVR